MQVFTVEYRNDDLGAWRLVSARKLFSTKEKAQAWADQRKAAHPEIEYRVTPIDVQ